MASKAAIEAGRGFVTLETRNLLQNGLDEAKGTLQAWGTSVMAIGAAVAAAGVLIAAPFLKGLDAFEAWGKSTRTAMRQTGMSFEELDLAMDGMKVSAEELVPAVAKMDEFLLSASQGSQEAQRALREMGLSLFDLQRASQGERLLLFADGLSRIGDAGERIARQRDVFGRGGLTLNLEGGAAGVRQRAERAEYLQGDASHSREALEIAKAYGIAKKELGMAMEGIWSSLAMAAAPVMTDFFRIITQIVVGVRQWLDANRPLLTTIFYIADKLILLGTAIGFVGSALYASSYAFTFAGGAVSIAGSAIAWLMSLASGGFGLLTLLTWTWGAATFAAGAVATAALFVHETGLLTLTAVTWAYNAAAAAVAAVWGLLTSASALATGATWGYTFALVAAWIWENLASAGIALLVTALGALVLAVGAVVLALGGFLLWGAAVALLPEAIDDLAESFDALFAEIGDSTWFANLSALFGKIVDSAQTAWAGIKAAFDVGEWGLLWDILKTTALLMWEHLSTYALGIVYAWQDAAADLFAETWTAMKVSFVSAWGEIKALFFDGIAALASGFTGLVNVIIAALNGMLAAVVGGLNGLIDRINGAIASLPASVRGALGLGELDRLGEAPRLESLDDGGRRFREMAEDERRGTRDEVAEIERQAIADWFEEQALRVERDMALAEGNEARVRELTGALEDLTAYAEFLRDARPALAGAGEGLRGPGMAGASASHVAGSFSAAVIAGFLGARLGAGETRGERDMRMARERLDEILRELERRPGVVMG